MQKKLLVIALAAIGATGSAQASAVADSVDQVTNFRFLTSSGAVLDFSAFRVLAFQDSTNLNPCLNAVCNPYSPAPVTSGPLALTTRTVPGAFAAVVPVFGSYIPPVAPTADGARASSSLNGDPITNLPNPQPIGANAKTEALAQLINPGFANSASNIGLIASFTFQLASAQAVTIDFDAVMHLGVWLNSLFSANAASTLTFDLVDQTTGGNNIFHFAPDGIVNLAAGEVRDDCSLNQSRGVIGPGQAVADCNGHFTATTPLLNGTDQYTFTIGQLNRADVLVQAVPEPTSLLLAGIALAGLGFGSRRKQASGG